MLIDLSKNDLMIIADCIRHYWEEYRPEGDQTDLLERIIAALGGEDKEV